MKNHIHILLVISRLILLACLAGLLSRCENFVEAEPPRSQLSATAVFENYATANAAMSDIYARIRDAGLLSGRANGGQLFTGAYGDDLVSYESGIYGTEPFYSNSLLASNNNVTDFWNTTYAQVYAANSMLEGLAATTALSTQQHEQLQGEALFVRALLHFYLTGLYGDVPYVTTTDYRINTVARRMLTAEVYQHCIADLETAVGLLPENYTVAGRIRPNKHAAQALLARVYLYAGLWAESSNAASAVLNNNTLYVCENDPEKVFLKDCTATIWQLMPSAAGKNTEEGLTYIFSSGPPPQVALNPKLMQAFEPGDLRREKWTKTVTTGGNSWSHAFKYKQRNNTGTTVEYSIVLRLGELYLVRAEARARQGELIGAKEDLDKVRSLAGLGATAALSQQDLIDAILRERRVELFAEYSHRFLDLKRTGSLDAALSDKPGWDPTDKHWPLPQAELLANGNLAPQNPGY